MEELYYSEYSEGKKNIKSKISLAIKPLFVPKAKSSPQPTYF